MFCSLVKVGGFHFIFIFDFYFNIFNHYFFRFILILFFHSITTLTTDCRLFISFITISRLALLFLD